MAVFYRQTSFSDNALSVNAKDLDIQTYNGELTGSVTIKAGEVGFHPYHTLAAGDTLIIENGARLYDFGGVANGTVINNGTHISK